MLSIPRTPGRAPRFNSSGMHTPNFKIQKQSTPMPYDHFLHAAVSLKQHIDFGEQSHRPIATPVKAQMFAPAHTSTPATVRSGLLHPWEVQKTNAVRDRLPSTIGFDEEEELSLDTSPESEHRPASVPLVNRALFRSEIPARPKTAEPVELRKAGNQPGSPSRKRNMKLTLAKTPYCARPTQSWLNRIKAPRDD
ncbi:Protein CBG13753 [Caenorhabditis briggsae]|uniref:Protein CBG13753 n=2 Tax=Caenorhabditis briggsae TaxID=6238 RepID=A8XIL9_CAEBR|nr:Protein CBG13753 [Caenorhabditis briggsae]ULT93277.1 hypothetical protein L3Y34_003038 [Caenorhabditis briggsae]CAP32494.1 Protein CBG13753 [Caenorhabditis briggsae]